jgi:hypothetical protein
MVQIDRVDIGGLVQALLTQIGKNCEPVAPVLLEGLRRAAFLGPTRRETQPCSLHSRRRSPNKYGGKDSKPVSL